MTVTLREWLSTDIDDLCVLANNKKIADNLRDRFPFPYTKTDAENWVKLNKDTNPPDNFSIVYNGKLAGGCGVMLKEDVYKLTAEVGYWIAEPYWDYGIATEAVKQLLVYVRQIFPHIIRIYAEVFAPNKASMRVLEKNNFQLESIRKNAVIKNNTVYDDQVWVLLLEK